MSTTIKILCANNAVGKLSTAITATSTTLVLSGSEGDLFPNAATGVCAFYATLADTTGNYEVVLVTAKSGNTFSVIRAQDRTTARDWPVNTEVSNRVTEGLFEDKVSLKEFTDGMNTKMDKNGGSFTGELTFTSPATFKVVGAGGETSVLKLFSDGTAFWNDLNLALLSHPIGSIYMSLDATSPADIFGGTWERLPEGRMLIGASGSYPAGNVGGNATHTLTVDELPSHNHGGETVAAGGHKHERGTMNITGTFGRAQCDYNYTSGVATGAFTATVSSGRTDGSHGNDHCIQWEFDASNSWSGKTSEAEEHKHTIQSQGGGTAINIMNPYVAVYMWKRTG